MMILIEPMNVGDTCKVMFEKESINDFPAYKDSVIERFKGYNINGAKEIVNTFNTLSDEQKEIFYLYIIYYGVRDSLEDAFYTKELFDKFEFVYGSDREKFAKNYIKQNYGKIHNLNKEDIITYLSNDAYYIILKNYYARYNNSSITEGFIKDVILDKIIKEEDDILSECFNYADYGKDILFEHKFMATPSGYANIISE